MQVRQLCTDKSSFVTDEVRRAPTVLTAREYIYACIYVCNECGGVKCARAHKHLYIYRAQSACKRDLSTPFNLFSSTASALLYIWFPAARKTPSDFLCAYIYMNVSARETSFSQVRHSPRSAMNHRT